MQSKLYMRYLVVLAQLWMITVSAIAGEELPVYPHFDIPSQSFDSALIQLSAQSGINILGLTESLKGIRSSPIFGYMAPSDALEHILKGTGLGYSRVGESSVSIIKLDGAGQGLSELSEKPPSSRNSFLEEIVVNGSKRSVDLQQTPIAITHIGQEQLAFRQIRDLRGISANVPGLEFVTTGSQESVLVQLRGVA